MKRSVFKISHIKEVSAEVTAKTSAKGPQYSLVIKARNADMQKSMVSAGLHTF